MLMKMKYKKGFTLVELIIVLAILAIISAIAVPRFIGVKEEARIDADISTGTMIGKAAELYIVSKDIALPLADNTSVKLSNLTESGRYMDKNTKFQYFENDVDDIADVEIIIDAQGLAKVNAKGPSSDSYDIQLYPVYETPADESD